MAKKSISHRVLFSPLSLFCPSAVGTQSSAWGLLGRRTITMAAAQEQPVDLAAQWAAAKPRITTHMNKDHAESIKAYLYFFAQLTDCDRGEMLDVDEKVRGRLQSYSWHDRKRPTHSFCGMQSTRPFTLSDSQGFLLRAFFPDKKPVDVRVEYPDGPIQDPMLCRKVAVAMHKTAYKGLGWDDPTENTAHAPAHSH